MKRLNILLSVAVCLILSTSCKKKYASEQLGPDIKIDFELLEPFKISAENVSFLNDNKVHFSAKMDKKIKWRVLITGEKSGATKTFEGFSDNIDSTKVIWDGGQDSLYYFRKDERCIVTMSAVNDIVYDNSTLQLANRGELIKQYTPLFSDTILIKEPKQIDVYTFDIFPTYGNGDFKVGFDDEIHDNMFENLPPVNKVGSSLFEVIHADYLKYATNGQGIRSEKYFMLKGMDQDAPLNPKNYYIGRLSTYNLSEDSPYQNDHDQTFLWENLWAGKYDPTKVYLNVFVYGNGDGSKINIALKEDEGDDGQFNGNDDEFFQKVVVVDFVGWKLFSFPYSEFGYQKNPPDKGHPVAFDGSLSNKIREPQKLQQVQFGLVAGTLGGIGQFIIDYPTLTLGGPLKY